MAPQVLFVSKPIAPPYSDGTQCLVRDVARSLERFHGHVMSTADARTKVADVLGDRATVHPVYAESGPYTPGLRQNARAALWLLMQSEAAVWHFVFAPNRATSTAGRVLSALRRVPVLQTAASPPRHFSAEVFFGNVVVAQSNWTRERIDCAFDTAKQRPPRIEVIPPPIGPLATRAPREVEATKATLELGNADAVFVYPGDLEFSRGAEVVARSVAPLVAKIPRAKVVFACRHKTSSAADIERRLAGRLAGLPVRFAPQGTDLLSLLSSAHAVLFPVDDLYGKVDLPISLLEAMALSVPVIAYAGGPLADLHGAVLIDTCEERSLVEAAHRLRVDATHRHTVVEAQKRAVTTRYAASVVARAYEDLYAELLSRAARD